MNARRRVRGRVARVLAAEAAAKVSPAAARSLRGEAVAPAIGELRAGVDSTLRVAAFGGFALTTGAVLAILLPVALLLGLSEVMPTWQAILLTIGVAAVGLVAALWMALRAVRRLIGSPRRAMARYREERDAQVRPGPGPY